jgi:RimK family alpha-L-glutamate ligase
MKNKRATIGYIFNEPRFTADEKAFLSLAKKKGIELVMINASKEIDEAELEDLIGKCDLFFNNSAEDFSLEIAKTIESLGKKVIDSPEQFYYDEDKWMFFLKCKKHNIPTAKTILLSESIPTAKKELKKFNQWPVILKRIQGTMGQFVEKAENLKQAESVIRKFWRKGNERLPIIAQEFISSPSYRATIIDGKVVQTAIKDSTGWKKTGVYLRDKNVKKFSIDKELQEIVKKLTKTFHLSICGVDLLKKDGKWVVLEINSEPAFDFFAKERKTLISQVLDFLKKRIKKR